MISILILNFFYFRFYRIDETVPFHWAWKMETSHVVCMAKTSPHGKKNLFLWKSKVFTTKKPHWNHQKAGLCIENTTSWLCAMELPWEILSWLVILIKIHTKSERKLSQRYLTLSLEKNQSSLPSNYCSCNVQQLLLFIPYSEYLVYHIQYIFHSLHY